MTPEEKAKYIAEHRDDLDTTMTRAKVNLMKLKTTVFLANSALKTEPQFVNNLPCPTAAANGKDIVIDPEFWMKQSEDQRTRVLFHEGFHNLMGHCDVRVNNETERTAWNIAADCVTESMANECGVGKGNYIEGCINPTYNGTVELNVNGKKMIISQCHTKCVEEIYHQIMDHVKKNPSKGGDGIQITDGHGKAVKTMDSHQLGEATTQEKIEREQALRQALVEHKLKDTMPGALANMIEDMLKGKINWKAELRDMIEPEMKSYLSAKKRNRRTLGFDLIMPGQVKEGVDVTFAIDTSGSIGTKEIEYYVGEIENLFKQFGEEQVKVALMFHHSTVYNVVDIKTASELNKIKTESGGTSHIDVFNTAEEMKCKVLICLTDGYSDFPEDTGSIKKVLWIVTNQRGAEGIPENLGKKIVVPIEELCD